MHANTIRTWSDSGRLASFRINERGDRRFLVSTIRAFMGSPGSGLVVGDGLATAQDGIAAIARRASLRRDTELAILGQVARLTSHGRGLDDALAAIADLLRVAFGYRIVGFFEIKGSTVVARAIAGADPASFPERPVGAGLVGRAISTRHVVFAPHVETAQGYVAAVQGVRAEIALPIVIGEAMWGALDVEDDRADALTPADALLLETVASQVAVAVDNMRLVERVHRQLHQAEAVRRIAADITAKLDLKTILSDLIEHALSLFAADHGAIFLRSPDGTFSAEVGRNRLDARLAAVREFPDSPLAALALRERHAIVAVEGASDRRGVAIPRSALREGIDTIAVAPLYADDEPLGMLALYHDDPRPYDATDVEAVGALAAQVGVAIKNARDYAQMATWAAQLRSIQQLGTRLSRLTTVAEIGLAIATELRLLIDNHNVRVYRLSGEDLVAVALRGHVGEYSDETPELLRSKIGEGITGWVARNGIAQLVHDAASDPRSRTIPGTQPDLDESMLLAPMLFEDRVVGVIVLSKLGLNQFTDDDLRLLVIYASFAAQAMANADATERLEAQSTKLARQLRSQQELLGITESILATLDPSVVLEQIADRLGGLVSHHNLVIERYEPLTNELRPLVARGPDAGAHMGRTWPADAGIRGWVVAHGEGQLVADELADPRVESPGTTGPRPGSIIVVPLRGLDRIAGVLMLERFDERNRFSEEEFDLVKLFAAQASIALRNAEIHRAVEIRAETDALTDLLNHGTFTQQLAAAVLRADPFSLLMLDLDDFKKYNDAGGHQAGDSLLRGIALTLRTSVRETDLVFRYGGDEFVLLLPGTDARGALAVAQKVHAAVRAVGRPDPSLAPATGVTASIGVATYPADGADLPSILLAADRACYLSKRRGRNCISTASEGLALAGTFLLTTPTPVDEPGRDDRP